MDYLQAIILGAIQGATEFLPVSSSGHLVIALNFMGLQEMPTLFSLLLHLATLTAVLIFFRRLIYSLLISLGRFLCRKADTSDRQNLVLICAVLLATLCTAVPGFAIKTAQVPEEPRIVGLCFIITALILVSSRFFPQNQDPEIPLGRKLLFRGAVTGFFQGIAVLPGISRSGITISAGLAAGFSRKRAGEFSFLLSIPAILGGFALEARDMEALSSQVNIAPLAMGLATAFIVGLISLALLMRFIRHGKLYYFSIYLILLGFFLLLAG